MTGERSAAAGARLEASDESIETLDAFADALVAIAGEAESDPEIVKTAPHTAPVRRLDEAGAARNPNLRWRPAVGDWTPCPD